MSENHFRHMAVPAEPGWVVASIDEWKDNCPDDPEATGETRTWCWIDRLVFWVVKGNLPYPGRVEDDVRILRNLAGEHKTVEHNTREWTGDPMVIIESQRGVDVCVPPGVRWIGPASEVPDSYRELAKATPEHADRNWY